MRHIKVKDNQITNYSIEQLFIDYPDAIIYNGSQMPNEKLLANYDIYPLITEAKPQLAEDETAEEGVPEFIQGEWHQTWTIRKLIESEIQEIIDNDTAESIGSTISPDAVVSSTMQKFTGLFANTELQEHRYKTCQSCIAFTSLKTCRECGCIMPLKIKLVAASCPLAKW